MKMLKVLRQLHVLGYRKLRVLQTSLHEPNLPRMIVSIYRGIPIWTPKQYDLYYGSPPKGIPKFGKPTPYTARYNPI